METVKAKIKGTNAILEGCVCDDSFFVSVDHDIFERYSLCEVEICKDSLQAQETCKENGNSFTDDLEEAANEYGRENVHYWYDEEIGDGAIYDDFEDLKVGFIAGAEWQKEHDAELIEIAYNDGITIGNTKQKEQMMKMAVEGEIGYWNQRGLSIRLEQSLEKIGYDEDTKVKVIIVKQDDRPRD